MVYEFHYNSFDIVNNAISMEIRMYNIIIV